MASNLVRDGDLQDFLHAHRPHGSLTADAVTFEHWITRLDAELDLLRAASLN